MRDYWVDLIPGGTIIVRMLDEGDPTRLFVFFIAKLLSFKVFYHYL